MKIKWVNGFMYFELDLNRYREMIIAVMGEMSHLFLKDNSWIVAETIRKHDDIPIGFLFDEINKEAGRIGVDFRLNSKTYNTGLFQDKVLTKMFEYAICMFEDRFKMSSNHDYDLTYCDAKIDCKVKSRNVFPKPDYDVTIPSTCVERGKYCDYFLFGTYNRNDIYMNTISYYVLGVIEYDEFVNKSVFRQKGSPLVGTGKICKMDEYVINIGSLHSIGTFMAGKRIIK